MAAASTSRPNWSSTACAKRRSRAQEMNGDDAAASSAIRTFSVTLSDGMSPRSWCTNASPRSPASSGAQRQVDRASVDLKLTAGLGRVIASKDVDQRRFPRPVLPEQTVNLAALHDDAHLV